MAHTTVQGTVAPGFEPVRDAFARNFSSGGEVGAALSVYRDGAPIIDLWGGQADTQTRTPWNADTLAIIFSATKALTGLAFLQLESRGEVDLDTPVAHWWPEFGTAGKEGITLRMLLNHRAGLAAIDIPFGFEELEHRERLLPALEAQRPIWAPDGDQGYHAIAFGPYLGEIFRRITGETTGTWIAREIAGPAKADIFLGLPDAEHERAATLYPNGKKVLLTKILPALFFGRTTEGRIYRQVVRKNTDTARAFRNPADLGLRGIGNANLPHVRRLELGWMGGYASARGLSRVYAAMLGGSKWDGPRLVDDDALSRIAPRQSWNSMDRVLRKSLGFSQGFLKEETRMFSPNPESFGHSGAGGALGWADPKAGLAIGYVMNQMHHHIRSPRALRLCHALYRCVDKGA